MEIFCKGCNKHVSKSDTYKFQLIGGRVYLAQQSKPWAREYFQKYHVQYQRKYRQLRKQKKLLEVVA